MRHALGVLVLGALALLGAAPGALADERADWGVAVSVGVDTYTLLLENDRGYQLVVIDPFGTITAAGLGPTTLSDVRPGDRIDYALSTWAGMDIADTLQVTPRRQAGVIR